MCFLLLFIITIMLSSCDVVKRVKENEHLITKNTILVDSQKTNDETANNLIIQKVNTGMKSKLGIPLRLHFYNLAQPNIDSVLQAKILDNPNKLKRKTKWLSRKQLDKYLESRKDFNSWIKRTGQAPVILNEEKTQKTANNLKRYYFSQGWFNANVDYDIKKDSNKRAQVTYKIVKKNPYFLDSTQAKISSPAINDLYNDFKKNSLLKKGQQYNENNFEKERERIANYLRNSGFYHFTKDYIRFEFDTIGTKDKIKTDILIGNRIIRAEDSSYTESFKSYKIKDINIFTDEKYENQLKPVIDSTYYDDFNLYSKEGLKYKPKAITDAIFMHKGDTYTDIDRRRSLRYLNDLQVFRYPTISFIENEKDTTLTANIYLQPKKKYGLFFNFDVSQSNIQTIGFSFGTGIKVRNIFRGAETLEISGIASIGSSRDVANSDDIFFDINEFGANAKLTIPRLFFPINTDKIIPKYMSPNTTINATITSQRNIGLDRQTLSSILSYNWKPSEKTTNILDLLNIQFVRNLSIDNYFEIYSTSFNRLNTIAQNINYTDNLETNQANMFINDVLSGNTSLTSSDSDFVDVSNIDERRNRLTENNLILSSSFDIVRNSRKSVFDNEFSIFKWHAEVAGNLLSTIANVLNTPKNSNGNYEIFDVAFSQYLKTEVDWVNYSDLGRKNIFAFRTYAGIAIPFGNSNSIPFVESFFGGGPNDNRAWTAYNLGPGSSNNINEFNEANLKIHLSAEQRFGLFGNLNGALFIDAGNIWNVLDNVEDEASTFTNFQSLQDIAIGSGFGLRYDFGFFVFRFDTGFKTYNPELPLNKRWFQEYNFSNAVYNIGINYPF